MSRRQVRSVKIPVAVCLKCGYRMDQTSALTDHRRPNPGDLSLCLNCGEVGRFGKGLKLEAVTAAELFRVAMEAPGVWDQLERGQKLIRERGPIRHRGLRTED